MNKFRVIDPETKLDELKMSESNFLITVNSNKRVAGDEAFRAHFTKVVRYFIHNIDKFFEVLEPGVDINDDTKIHAPEVVYNIEEGPKTQKLHCHIAIEIDHSTKLRFDLPKARAYFNHNMNAEGGVYMQLKLYYKRSDSKRVNWYTLKEIERLREKNKK